MTRMPVTLVTGTSSGIGFATALYLAKRGHTMVATMRSLAKAGPLETAARDQGVRLVVRELDVTSQASIDRALAATRETEGAIDVLVNNAGIGGATPLELTPEAEHRAMFEVNYWGPIRMIQAVLPSMRERRAGYIVNVTSIAGRIATPNQIPYSASKHALAAASEALAHEVAAFGVRVAIIEPGVIQTAIFENSAAATRYDKASPYRQIMRRNGKLFAAGSPTRSTTPASSATSGSSSGRSAPFLSAVALLAQEVLQLAHQLIGVDAVGQSLGLLARRLVVVLLELLHVLARGLV